MTSHAASVRAREPRRAGDVPWLCARHGVRATIRGEPVACAHCATLRAVATVLRALLAERPARTHLWPHHGAPVVGRYSFAVPDIMETETPWQGGALRVEDVLRAIEIVTERVGPRARWLDHAMEVLALLDGVPAPCPQDPSPGGGGSASTPAEMGGAGTAHGGHGGAGGGAEQSTANPSPDPPPAGGDGGGNAIPSAAGEQGQDGRKADPSEGGRAGPPDAGVAPPPHAEPRPSEPVAPDGGEPALRSLPARLEGGGEATSPTPRHGSAESPRQGEPPDAARRPAEAHGEGAIPTDATAVLSQDSGPAGLRAAPGAATPAGCTADLAENGGGAEQDTPQWVPRDGGWTAAWPTGRPVGRTDAARRIVRALERLVARTVGPTGDPTPRIDPARLVRELVSRRCSLSRARREEHARRLVLVGCDVSGSCSAAAEDTVAAAYDLAARDDRVVVVIHSNGCVGFLHGRGPEAASAQRALLEARQAPPVDRSSEDTARVEREVAPWLALIRRAEVGLLVAFGDGDAAWAYARIASAQTPLVWLDSHLSRCVKVPQERRMRLGEIALRPRYFVGVNSAERAALALEHLARS